MASRWPPNWKNRNHYPTPNTTTTLQWAWEFLRRNPEYQRLWSELIAPTYNSTHLKGTPGKSAPGYRYRRVIQSSPKAQFEAKFHISSFPPPPPRENKAKLNFNAPVLSYQIASTGGSEAHGTVREGEVIVWFNLRAPINPQIANAKKLLTEFAKRDGEAAKFRRTVRDYPTYLRLLDAQAAGASTPQILRILYPNLSPHYPNHNAQQTLRDDLKTAKRLRDRDFWLIAASAQE